jgi:hypothetical protein
MSEKPGEFRDSVGRLSRVESIDCLYIDPCDNGFGVISSDSDFLPAAQACMDLATEQARLREEARNPIVDLGGGCKVLKDGTPVRCLCPGDTAKCYCPRGMGYRAALCAHGIGGE